MRFRAPRNLGWKLGSLLLAALLWAAMSVEPDVVTTHGAPVLYQNLPPGYALTGNSVDTVRLELRGPTGQLTSANLNEIVVSFNLATAAAELNQNAESQEHTLTISDQNVNLPRGVAFLRAVPSQLRVRLARLGTKDAPVEIQFSGEPPAGLRVISSRASPDRLQVIGTENRLQSVTNVLTDPIDLRHLPASGETQVNVYVPDPQVRFSGSPTVMVRVTFGPAGN